MTTEQIANRLVALCRAGQIQQAQSELYGEKIISIEQPTGAAEEKATGLEAVVEKGKQFAAMIEEHHGLTLTEPVVTGKLFSMGMSLDATMKGRGRVLLEEICVYRTENGKIVFEQFIY